MHHITSDALPISQPNSAVSHRSSQTCPLCSNPANDAMVNCVKCQNWFHQSCANVAQPIPHAWFCLNCNSLSQIPAPPSSINGRRSIASNSSSSRRTNLQLQLLEEERQLAISRDREFLKKKLEILQSGLDEDEEQQSESGVSVRQWLCSSAVEPHGAPTTNLSSTTAPTRHIELDVSNAADNNNYNTLGSGITLTQANSLPSYTYSATFNTTNHQLNNNTYSAAAALQTPTNTTAFYNRSIATPNHANNVNHTAPTSNANTTGVRFPTNVTFAATTNLSAPNPFNAPDTNIFSSSFRQSFMPNSSLTAEQMNARHAVPKELPNFTGNPEEWPLFSSTFDWSTAVCGLTDAENLVRLQRALKGDALRSVQHLLIHPSCVAPAISTLKLLYGQPERILCSVKNRIKNTATISVNKLESISNFAVSVKGYLAILEACGLCDEINNSSLLQDLVDKLPPNLQLDWGTIKLKLIKENKKPNLVQFADWIFDLGLSASITNPNVFTASKYENSQKARTQNAHLNAHSSAVEHNCLICNKDCENVTACHSFLSADRKARWRMVRDNNLCKKCLKCTPKNTICKCNKKCAIENCEFKHNELLHNHGNSDQVNAIIHNSEPNQNIEICNTHQLNDCILFKILPVNIKANGKSVSIFAFIDEGSSVSLIDESLINELGITGNTQNLCLKWTAGMQRTEESSKKVKINIAGANNKCFTINAHTVRQLGLPAQSVNYKDLCKQYPHLKGLPIDDYIDATPRILLGADNWSLGIPLEVRESSPDTPVAVRLRLGWLIYGNGGNRQVKRELHHYHICECDPKSNDSLNTLVKQYFSLEHIGVQTLSKPICSKEDERAFQLLQEYTRQRSDNHYETCLLWRFENVELPESLVMAKRRLLCLERRLLADKQLYNIFAKTINDYMQKGYVRKLSPSEINDSAYKKRSWYLPIFPVFNKNKPNKTRIVWDAASQSQGVSLNSMLLKGPDFISSLPAILCRFREKSVAVSGDIKEMFHQIFIREEDRHSQRFLWRGCNQNIAPEVYVMNVMIFGAACAPSISQYIKNTNAAKFQGKFSDAALAIQQNHYVDDFLGSVDTIEQAIKLASDIKFIHHQGGFHIRNWCCNRREVLLALDEKADVAEKSLAIDEKHTEKVLGVFWNPQQDALTFKLSAALRQSNIFVNQTVPTKREVLRIVMSVYDPLGLLGNVIMYAKVLLQDIWRSHVGWDDPIKPNEMEKWLKWLKNLPEIENVIIPRCYLKTFNLYDGLDVQLHVFVDASENGYATVCYFRVCNGSSVQCSLIGSKTRVAPLKMISIPRLELMSALIGARYAKFIGESHNIKFHKKFFWSDSKTVLCWLRSDQRRYHQFVAFRISEILDLSELQEWRWIPSKQNVADDATKWTKLPDLSATSRWFHGPNFLRQPECSWPVEIDPVKSTNEDLKHHVLVTYVYEPLFDVSRFSKWQRLLRAAAYVMPFIQHCKGDRTYDNKATIELTTQQLNEGENILLRQSQQQFYAKEINMLRNKIQIPKSSDLYKLTPFSDSANVLRIQGRLAMADVDYQHKFPIILHRKSRISLLIIDYYHRTFHHMNHETTLNEIRQRFYIGRLRATFKTVINNCQMCNIRKASPLCPLMATLPRARLAAFTHPFTFTGLDFFGPISVVVNRHIEKRYGALFTCLTLRAVHIEVVHSLTTSSCIMAIRNFMARRGTPQEFFSDNATNFVGAERELRESLSEIDNNIILREFTTVATKWSFNPPAAPHMGGAWERMVRSVKTVLYNIMPSRKPDDELLRTMLAEVENIVNSRPLTYVSLENENADVLTPNHLLLGRSNGLKPLALYDDDEVVVRHSWLASQQFADLFWRRWVREYLPSLTCRTKWHENTRPLQLGDLVLIVDAALPRNLWLRGKVIEVRNAADGQTRSATVMTKNGVFQRPTTKLAVLDVAEQKE